MHRKYSLIIGINLQREFSIPQMSCPCAYIAVLDYYLVNDLEQTDNDVLSMLALNVENSS